MQANTAPTTHARVPRLLSLDSGGQRGLSQLTILAELLAQLNEEIGENQKTCPCDVFDMIGGTGSGGFIAILLVVFGLNMEKAWDEFILLCTDILNLEDVDSQGRTEALKRHVNNLLNRFGIRHDRHLMDSNRECKLVVPISYQVNVASICTLRNFRVRKGRPYDVTVAEALMATLANPPFFAPVSISQVLAEAYKAFGSAKGEVFLLSIGCGHPDVIALPNPSDKIGWYLSFQTLAKNPEGTAQELRAGMTGQGHYHRFSVIKGLGNHAEATKLTNGDIVAHTEVYLSDPDVSAELARCATYLEEPAPILNLEAVHPSRKRLWHIYLVIFLALCLLSWFFCSRYQEMCGNFLRMKHRGCPLGSNHTSAHLDNVSTRVDLNIGFSQTYHGEIPQGQRDSAGETVFIPALRAPTKTFVMRQRAWEYITNAMLSTADSEKLGGRMLVVTGMGGCGKTEIILKFIQQHEAEFSEILLIDGSTESRIREDITRYVRLKTKSQFLFKDCLLFLAQPSANGPRLIVYDNTDDPKINLTSLLPGGTGCTIIITSRNRSIGAFSPHAHLELGTMTIAEAVELLLHTEPRSNAQMDQVREDARAVAEALGCLPLALQQARSYMFETQIPARTYLKRFQDSRDDILSHPIEYPQDMRYLSTFAAFNASITILPDRVRNFLLLLSFFHWSKFPLELVLVAGRHDFSDYKIQYTEHGDEYRAGKTALEEIFFIDTRWNAMNLDKLMVSLQKYSLVTIFPGITTTLIEMHPLLHSWVQYSLPEGLRLKYQSAAPLLLALGSRFDHTSSTQYLASHIAHLSPLWGDLHINTAAAFGEIMSRTGMYTGAAQLQEKVVATLRERVDGYSTSLTDSISALGTTYYASGRLKEAEGLQLEVLKLRNETLGESHPDTIATSENLATIYLYQGRLNEAEVLQLGVLRLRNETLGDSHPDTITSCKDLAAIYYNQGRLIEARDLGEEVLSQRKKILGSLHPHTLTAAHGLALIYYSLGRLNEAELLQVEVLRSRKQMLGERHPTTLTASSNLASIYLAQGRIKEAELGLMESLQLRREILGMHHPHTITASNNLAAVYLELRRLNEAEVLLVETVRLMKMTLGERHPGTIGACNNLAVAYRRQGRLGEAETLQVEALRLRKEILGVFHPDTFSASENLALIYMELGRLDEASILEENVLSSRKAKLGELHPSTLTASQNVASIYRKLGRTGEAKLLQLEVLRIRNETVGERHPRTISAATNIAGIYRELGQPEQAYVLQVEALRLSKEVLGDHHPDTIAAFNDLAIIRRDLGGLEEAEAMQVQAIGRMKETLGERHPVTIQAMLNLAMTYEAQVDKTGALNLLDAANGFISETLGQSHPLYQKCQGLKSHILNLEEPGRRHGKMRRLLRRLRQPFS